MRIRYDELSPPAGWSRDKIGNRLTLNYGKSQASIRADDGTTPIYGTGGLMGYGVQSLCAGDSVLIGRKGTLDNPLYIDHPFWPVDTTYYTSDFNGSVEWLYYLLQTIDLSALNEATGVPSLSRQTFYNVDVLFPPPEQQTAVADVLATVDRVIEQTEALIVKQRRIKAGLMHDLLTRGIDEHGNLRHPSTHEFKESVLGLIPMEWDMAVLSEMVPFNRPIVYGILMPGYGFPNGVPVIKVKDIVNDEINQRDLLLTDPKIDEAYRRSRVRSGDLLFTIRGTVGRMAFVPPNLDGANITQDTARISISEANPRFVRYFLDMPVSSQYSGVKCQRNPRKISVALCDSSAALCVPAFLRRYICLL